MSLHHLKIKVDPNVFKFKLPIIDKLRTGKLSAQALALLATATSPYVLIGDTVYALTESEYYAMRMPKAMTVSMDAIMAKITSMDDLSFMTEADADMVNKIKTELPGCPSCRARKFKDVAYKLVKKYNIDIPEDAKPEEHMVQKATDEYPETTGDVLPIVSTLLEGMYQAQPQLRKPCMDCVEKHVSQAYITGKEALQGYPEYVSLVAGHLCEALEETPREFVHLRRTLEFCLARTNYTGSPFVPLSLIHPLIRVAKNEVTSLDSVPAPSQSPEAFNIDITDEVSGEISQLDQSLLPRAISLCRAAQDSETILEVENEHTEESRLSWEGALGNLADHVVNSAPALASMLRNRRLLFSADPIQAVAAGYSICDVLAKLEDLG